MAELRVTLVKSVVGQQWRARRVVQGLGLTKVNQSRVLPDNDCIRGMIKKIPHLVKSEPVTASGSGAGSASGSGESA